MKACASITHLPGAIDLTELRSAGLAASNDALPSHISQALQRQYLPYRTRTFKVRGRTAGIVRTFKRANGARLPSFHGRFRADVATLARVRACPAEPGISRHTQPCASFATVPDGEELASRGR